MLSIQYLEASPDLARYDISTVVERLRTAAEKLPISHLLIGWHLPQPLLEACRLEAEHLGIRFLRWQPLLTTDQEVHLHPSWQTVNLPGEKVQVYRGLPEFSFFCPNHPAVQETISLHLEALIQQGVYQGFFLDRVRFASPAIGLIDHLACFCEYCQRKAVEVGLDLSEVRSNVLHQNESGAGRLSLVKTLLSGKIDPDDPGRSQALVQFLAFRQNVISEFLARIAQRARGAGLELGLDCFSPCLAGMVGQHLTKMSSLVDWVKLMTYAHTLAPAGLPYELSGWVKYLTASGEVRETQALDLLGKFTGLPLPRSRKALINHGLSPSCLEMEVKRGIESCSAPILAGMELVDLPGITRLSARQIRADLSALKRAGPAGLGISWDLWHIPLDRLELVRQAL